MTELLTPVEAAKAKYMKTETEYLDIKNLCAKAHMSSRIIRGHLKEIPHTRFAPRGKIWIRWADFEAWMDRHRTEASENPNVMAGLEALLGRLA